MRKIIFTSRKVPNNSFKMRGEQMCRALIDLGYDCKIVEPHEVIRLSGCIVIWVRRMIVNRRALRVNYRNNIVLYDPLDRISEIFKCAIYPYIHAFIFPYKNHWIINDSQLDKKLKYTLYHHYDPRIILRTYKHFELGYYGYSTSADHTRNVIIGNNRYSSTRIFPYNFFERISCHYNVRTISKGFGWRPTTKISTAAGAGCNIITSRDKISEEMLPGDYPYFLGEKESGNLSSVIEMIEKAKGDFGNSRWNYGLECMRSVREKTNIRACAIEYGKILEEIDGHY